MIELKMYCLSCKQIVKVMEGGEVFKTGFFRSNTPMGICAACKQKDTLPDSDNGGLQHTPKT